MFQTRLILCIRPDYNFFESFGLVVVSVSILTIERDVRNEFLFVSYFPYMANFYIFRCNNWWRKAEWQGCANFYSLHFLGAILGILDIFCIFEKSLTWKFFLEIVHIFYKQLGCLAVQPQNRPSNSTAWNCLKKKQATQPYFCCWLKKLGGFIALWDKQLSASFLPCSLATQTG